jgi:hypothetical protein
MENKTMEELKEWLKSQLVQCETEYWFPDDDSKREGYLEAIEQVIWHMEESNAVQPKISEGQVPDSEVQR